ncbi:SDR family NAD(P)-dependent oxidoreductase [Chryseobacterium terrae]|uniref:SDR family NAD(P)-dependent oxidoreductase n=1 Tax=Chryseobacterium terrae TaxID=3163299 RepID=A0ABW8Y2T1_9FLAO
MKKVFITGANKSIGYETAKQLLKEGYYVYLGTRNLENGLQAVEQLLAEGLSQVEAIQIDVTSQQSVDEARKEIGDKTAVLDVLINNAGMSGVMPQFPTTASMDSLQETFNVNLFGAVRTTQAFINLLRKSEEPHIVNVTSGLASLSMSGNPEFKYRNYVGGIYSPSKAALNMYTIALANELRDTPFKVNAVDPGFTATDFNNHQGTGSVEEAGKRILKYAMLGKDGVSGMFISEEINPETGVIAW